MAEWEGMKDYVPSSEETQLKDFLTIVKDVQDINTVLDAMGKQIHAGLVTETLVSILSLFKDRVQYALGGGFAVSYYAKPRATTNLSFVVPSSSYAHSVLLDNGFIAKSKELLKDGNITIHKYLKGPIEIEILEITDSEFAKGVFQRVRQVSFVDSTISLLSSEDLRVLKGFSNQPQDLIDIEALEQI